MPRLEILHSRTKMRAFSILHAFFGPSDQQKWQSDPAAMFLLEFFCVFAVPQSRRPARFTNRLKESIPSCKKI